MTEFFEKVDHQNDQAAWANFKLYKPSLIAGGGWGLVHSGKVDLLSQGESEISDGGEPINVDSRPTSSSSR